jgi:HD-GYP domain-containing protein (c-di-GMP phosphodiesterase class II)
MSNNEPVMLTIVGKSIDVGPVPFDIFMRDDDGQRVLFCRAGYSITPQRRQKLTEDNRTFFVVTADMPRYLDYVSANLDQIVENPEIPLKEKTLLVKSVSQRLVQRILSDPKSGAALDETRGFVQTYIGLLLSFPQITDDIFILASKGGSYLLSRSLNVCTLCLLIGEKLYGRKTAILRDLGVGGMLLDLGMTRIDHSIIDKPEKLSEEEIKLIRLHPHFSEEILRTHGGMSRDVLKMVRGHHERDDGSGYPDGLKAEQIHPYAQVAAVADTYDAITSDKPYREMASHMEALREIRRMKGAFDPYILTCLVQVVLRDQSLVDRFLAEDDRLDNVSKG